MSPWNFSWLPSLPSIDFTLPSSIQRRFISFVLQNLLGNLVKPGQLDANQIDSQIGSGFVQVRDLELDNEVRLGTIMKLSLGWLTKRRLLMKPSQAFRFSCMKGLYPLSLLVFPGRIRWCLRSASRSNLSTSPFM